jgi:hypothetical protein
MLRPLGADVLLGLVLALIVIGVLLWLVEHVRPLNAWTRSLVILNIVVVVGEVLWLLNVFGVCAMNVPGPRVR